jgi:hypothetical protein
MKRIITFLLVLSIALASFACTSNSNSFTPLQNTIVSVEDHLHPQMSATHSKVSDIINVINTDEWIETTVRSTSPIGLLYTMTDSKGDLYQFFTGSTRYLLITRRGGTKFAYLYPDELLQSIDDYLAELINSDPNSDLFIPLRHDLVSVTAYDRPEYSTDSPRIKPLRGRLSPTQWKSSAPIDPKTGKIYYSLIDAVGDRYDFYDGDFEFIIVTQADSSTHSFTSDLYQITAMTNFLDALYSDPKIDEKRTYMFTTADLSVFDDSKLITALPEEFDTIQETLLYITEQPTLEANQLESVLTGPTYFTLKDDKGTYVTLYKSLYESTIDCDFQGSICYIVSVGTSANGSSNAYYGIDPWMANGLISTVVYPAISGSSPLDLKAYTFTQVDIYQALYMYNYILEPVSRPYNNQFKAIMDTLSTSTWTLVTDVDESMVFQRIRLSTNTTTTLYLAANEMGNSVYVVVDEDPSTVGAYYYRRSTNPWATNFLMDFTYAAQIPLKEAPVIDPIKSINDYDPDAACYSELPYITLSSSQSASITALLKPETWTEVNYMEYERFSCNERVILKVDDNRRYVFDYFSDSDTRPYVRFFYDRKQYFMPKSVFMEILEAIEALR